MQYREEQFLEREAKLGREWHTIGEDEEDEEDEDEDYEEAAAAAESSDDAGEARDNGNDDDADDFSILSVVEGRNPRVTERKLDLDLSSAKSALSSSKRNSELVIGTRDSPRYRPEAEAADEEAAAGQRRRSHSEERTTTTSSSSSLSSSTSTNSTTTTKPTTPREAALTDPLQSPGLRKSTSALGNHRSSIAPAVAAPATTGDNSRFGGGRSGSDDTSYSDSGVEEALEDLLKVTEELKNSVLLRDDDDDDDDDSGADVSWRDNNNDNDNNSGSDSEPEAGATSATGDRQRGGVMIASARGRQQPTSPPASHSQQNGGTFGSLQEDLSDFEFLYAAQDGSSSSASTTPSKSQHRFPKPSSLKKYFLE